MIIPANIGYLQGIVYKEITAGRKCEITGSIFAHIDDLEEYRRKKPRLVGKFGEVVSRAPNNTALIATRTPPLWVEKKIHEVIWDCDEMLRWEVPENDR